MALSGRAETTWFAYIFMQLTWTATQSIANNTSTIKWSLDGRNRGDEYPNGEPYEMAGNFYLSINGQVLYDKPQEYRIKLTEGVHIADGTIVVPHNSDGSKTCAVKMEAAIYNQHPNCYYDGTLTLDTIPRASTFGDIYGSAIGNGMTVNILRHASIFTHQLWYKLGDSQWYDLGKGIETSKTFTVSMDLCSQIPNSTSGNLQLCLRTYNGNTQIGSDVYKNIPVSVQSDVIPSIISASVNIDNSANSVVEGWGVYVSGYSKAQILASASGTYGSTIKSFAISGGYDTTVNGSSLNYTGGKFTSSGSKTFNVVAKDSRGRSSAQTTAGIITVYAYNTPKIALFSVERSSTSATTMIVKSSWSFASVNGKNSASAVLLYKKATSSGWTTYGTIENNQSVTLEGTFDEASSYNFKIIVTDALSNKAQAETFVSTLAVLLDFRAGGKGLGIGKIAETDSMEIALDAKFMGNIYIYDSSGNSMSLDEYIRYIVGA